ncbi:MAG: orotate phosphoribosyltransferase [Oscillospiraceae bacterium]|jgi:orotate phosphoribosyltransferase|nr:orotate phosphoribosyltransferase [Oscillospiraceae bacterium]
METRMSEIVSRKNEHIKIGMIPGHFATNHSHVNCYVDMDSVKCRFKIAKEAARVISSEYVSTPVDTIICLEGTRVLGALIAEQLSENYSHSVNDGRDICVITPELDSNRQMIFRDNTQKMVWNKQVLLLISSASTGRTIERSIECLKYYSGKLAAVTAIFSAIDEAGGGIAVHSLFTAEDLPGYFTLPSAECPMCREKQKVDAIINEHGYSKI